METNVTLANGKMVRNVAKAPILATMAIPIKEHFSITFRMALAKDLTSLEIAMKVNSSRVNDQVGESSSGQMVLHGSVNSKMVKDCQILENITK